MEIKPHNFWYAVNNTRIVLMPRSHLETFGATHLRYHMVSELMDSVNHIRIREGAIQAHRAQIVTPTYYENETLEGFGEQAREYADWLRQHARDLVILQYGFKIQKTEFNEHVVTGHVTDIIEQVKKTVQEKNDPMSGIIHGVDAPWDVCLLKYMVDVIRTSAPANVNELGRRRMLDDSQGVPRAVREDIEESFQQAVRDPSLANALGVKLRKYGLFEEYEDRFFALLKR